MEIQNQEITSNNSNPTLLDKIKSYTKHSIMPTLFALGSFCAVFSLEKAEATTPGNTIIYNNMDNIVSGVDGLPLGRENIAAQNPLNANYGNHEYFQFAGDAVFSEYNFKFVLTDFTDRTKIISTNEIVALNLEFTYGDSVAELRTNAIQSAGLPFSFRLDIPKPNFSITDTGDTQILNDGTTTKIFQSNFRFSHYLGNKKVLIPDGKVLRIKPTLSFNTLNADTDYLLLSTDNTDLSNNEITDGVSLQLAGDTVYNPLEKLSELSGLPQIVSQYASESVFYCIDLKTEMKFNNIFFNFNSSSISVVWDNSLYFKTPSLAIKGYSSIASYEAGDLPIVQKITSLEDPTCGCVGPAANPEIVYPIGVAENDRENYFIREGNFSFSFPINSFGPNDTPFFTIEKS